LAVAGEVRLRLIRGDDRPATNPLGEPFEFGLQDTKQAIDPGVRRENGAVVFDLVLTAKPGPDPNRPVFSGRYASGPADDRFVYLAWRSIPRGVWINRVKARLSTITWEMVEAARSEGRLLAADMSGWGPHDARHSVEWKLAED
jgi:hypothetical protein